MVFSKEELIKEIKLYNQTKTYDNSSDLEKMKRKLFFPDNDEKFKNISSEKISKIMKS